MKIAYLINQYPQPSQPRVAVALTPETGWLGMALVAFAGAASVIVGQRWWHTHA